MVYANAVNFPYKTQDFIYSLVKPLHFGKSYRKRNTILPNPLFFDSGSRRMVSQYLRVQTAHLPPAPLLIVSYFLSKTA